MPILAAYKLKVAARLNSRALRADAVESITCGYLSIVLMVGLAATRVLGWWWLDSVAALALIPFLQGRSRSHFGRLRMSRMRANLNTLEPKSKNWRTRRRFKFLLPDDF